ncbi:hypothetical protein GCM10023340_44680 [Nocardioides marinquilinus]|uniref:L,D-TPase catalytic domain-containing protein n=1 Tax=Nocardioides marinquilinus TaxID=1210400 RepID=A0ABP9Q6S3_9ACTN
MLGISLTTTAIALLGGVGVLPSAADDTPHAAVTAQAVAAQTQAERDDVPAVATPEPTDDAAPSPRTAPSQPADKPTDEPTEDVVEPPTGTDDVESSEGGVPAPLPADSGDGRRVVFSETEQRVWLVDDDGTVERTYLVSGSLTDNLDPGTYEVFSRSEDAIGIDGSEMKLFVRFTRGPSGAAIGFHTIPTDPTDGDQRMQTIAQLGTPRSHGCIRQATPDAKAMWDFADDGTTVVVV